jgi:SagB-type dehydrogenase family enzyme
MDDRFLQGRHFLKSNWHLTKESQSDQSMGLPPPLQELPPQSDESVVALPPVESAYAETTAGGANEPATLHSFLKNRKSRRLFKVETISIAELSYLLWSCEGVRENKGKYSFRTTPSGGARHPLDLYVFARRVEGLKPGLYRYLPLEHSLVLEREGDDSTALNEALMGQLVNSSCVVMWAAVPYRSEWRYGKAADKLVALDAGHSCQNLYLACEALGLGTCAIGAYDQKKLDEYLGLDGEDMFAMYAAPVGKPTKR